MNATTAGMTTITSATTTASNVDISGGMRWDDATWILTCSFIVFTMQTGFGLLEAGVVSARNESNILFKNAADVVCGGITYWMFGYAFSFGMSPGSNPIIGWGDFFLNEEDPDKMGSVYTTFVFQLSFATTATTIVSGVMVERTKVSSYLIFSFVNTIVYCVPAHWIWAPNGWLQQLGVIDIAGSGAVHLVGGASALVATWMLGPRLGLWDDTELNLQPGNPTNCILGTFALWWGWLGFNCGSMFGMADGKWKLSTRAAINTFNASMGGGVFGLVYSFIRRKGIYNIFDLCNGILSALVGITAGCAVMTPWEAMIVGLIGAMVAVPFPEFMEYCHIDDPVGAISVHGVAGFWGLLAVGIFAQKDNIVDATSGKAGIFHGGGFYLFGVQLLAGICIALWSCLSTFTILYIVDRLFGLRMSRDHEIKGADHVEHGLFMELGTDDAIEPEKSVSQTQTLKINQSRATLMSVATLLKAPDHRKSILYQHRGSFGLRSMSVVLPNQSVLSIKRDSVVVQ